MNGLNRSVIMNWSKQMTQMTQIPLAVCWCASIVFPAPAQSVHIDDNGWSAIKEIPGPGRAIDIGDDGWSYVDPPATQSSRRLSNPRTCTMLERSAGLAKSICGPLSRSEVINALTVKRRGLIADYARRHSQRRVWPHGSSHRWPYPETRLADPLSDRPLPRIFLS